MTSISHAPRIRRICIGKRKFEIASITPRCHTITDLESGEVRQYRDHVALMAYVDDLQQSLSTVTALNRQLLDTGICDRCRDADGIVTFKNADGTYCRDCAEAIEVDLGILPAA